MLLQIALLLASYASVEASPLAQRAVTCSTIITNINTAGVMPDSVAFCRQLLAIKPVTTIKTSTNVNLVTKTGSTTTTVVRTTTPALNVKTAQTKTTKVTTIIPPTTTVTNVVTKNAWIDNEGNTITTEGLAKRADATEGLARRALATPAPLKGLSLSDLKAACACLNIAAVTYTRSAVVQTTSIINKMATKTQNNVVQAPTPLTTQTVTSTIILTVTAPAPQAVVTQVAYEDNSSCPPNTNTAFSCPEGTGDDDGSLADDDQMNCPVVSADSQYSGFCIYWADDGSPAGSQLESDDGNGNISYRDATYGDDDTDDCPSWSDYSCTPTSGGSRKRWFLENAMSPAEKGSSLTRKLKPIPKGLRRGGHRVDLNPMEV